jgi:acetyl-CoA carboxylase biotin carboxyl carrier protein
VPLTAQDVAEITRLLEESQFDELHLEHAGFKLTLKRGAAVRREDATASAPAPSPAPASAGGPAGAGCEPRGEYPASASDGSVLEVTAPFVGIFYRAPRPGAPPYIEVGSQVEADTTVGIIEVMKLMNAVRAEVSGTVFEVLVEDGAVVEYGQVLLRIAPGAPGG